MGKASKLGMAVPRRIRSSARAKQIRRRRSFTHFCLALVAALLVSSWSYHTASDQPFIKPESVEAAGLAASTSTPSVVASPAAPIAVTADTADPTPLESASPTSFDIPTLPPTQPPAPTRTPVPEIVLPSITPTSPPANAQGGSVPPPLKTPAQGESQPPILYYTQSGDTLDALAVRFGVQVGDIRTTGPVPPKAFIPPAPC